MQVNAKEPEIYEQRVLKGVRAPCLSADYVRGGRPRLCQGAEEQVPDQALLRQTPTHGLPTRPDHPGGRQHGNVSHTHTDRKRN